jgi:hypothetical protein
LDTGCWGLRVPGHDPRGTTSSLSVAAANVDAKNKLSAKESAFGNILLIRFLFGCSRGPSGYLVQVALEADEHPADLLGFAEVGDGV